jgi:hypothetical protein
VIVDALDPPGTGMEGSDPALGSFPSASTLPSTSTGGGVELSLGRGWRKRTAPWARAKAAATTNALR